MHRTILGLLVGGLALAATTSPASAASVSVEIEGKTVITPPTLVQTAAAVAKPGGASCTGPSPATALETLTGGDWDGGAYSVERILAEAHPIAPGGSSWAVYLNGRFVNDTVCTAAVADGDKVLYFWSDAFASEGYDEPVLLDAPTTATPGQPFAVKVSQADTTFDSVSYLGTTAITPAADAAVAGGAAAATTGADGSTQVTVPAGPYTLVATKANRAPARLAGCATTGSDGFCGTTAPAAAAPVGPCVTKGDDGLCGTPDKRAANGAFTALTEGKKYAKGQGPRELTGRIAAEPAGIADVRVRLTRNDGGDCSTFDGKRERFVKLKQCGATRGLWFSVGAKQDFSYLLPAKLGKGRYVLDLEVTDKAGNKTAALARGTSRVVFTVA